MFRRIRDFQTDQLVFFKAIKENQDHRFDVPVLGRKLQLMIESNIHTAVLEKDSVIPIDKENVLNKARANQIQLIGFDPTHFSLT